MYLALFLNLSSEAGIGEVVMILQLISAFFGLCQQAEIIKTFPIPASADHKAFRS